MKMHLDLLPDFLRGTAFLGTGGGGDPYVGGLILRQKLEEGADITIMDPMDSTTTTSSSRWPTWARRR